MAYGSIKVDNIIYTKGGSDTTITVSGIVDSLSGAISVTGSISGASVSAATGTFTTLSGNTTAGTTATFVTGVFTTTLSGATITGDAGQFSNITGVSGVFTTRISGATITGNTGQFTSITGGSGVFTSFSGTTVTATTGVFASGTAAAPSISVGTTTNGLYSSAANEVAVSTSGNSRLVVDASGNVNIDAGTFYVDAVNNNVGVGTSSPADKLEVASSATNTGVTIYNNNGSGGLNARLSFKSLNGYDASSVLAAITAAPTASSNTATSLVFSTSGNNSSASAGLTERLRLDASGNLGLGVTPSAWNSGARVLQISSTSSFYGTSNATLIGQNTFNNTSGNNIYLTTAAASLYQQFGGAHSWYTAPSGFGYGTAATSLTSAQNGKSYTIVTAGDTNFTLIGAADNNVGTTFTKSGGTGTGTGTVSQNITFTQAMTLDASGNLGVGATLPGAKFHVAGDSSDGTQARITGATNQNYQLRWGFDTTNLVGRIQSIHVGTAYKSLSLNPDGGNVGIGTTEPGALLDISGSGNIVRLGDGTNSCDVRFKGPNNWAVQLNTSTDVFNIQRNSVSFVNINGAGNVGIGTATPSNTAGYSQQVEIAGTLPCLTLNQTNAGFTTRKYSLAVDAAGAFGVWDNTASAYRAYIDSSGRLLVGTTSSPSAGELLRVEKATTGTEGAGIRFGGTYTIEDNGTQTFTIGNAALVFVSNNTTGNGALFFCSLGSATISLLSDPDGVYATSVTAGKVSLTKTASSATITLTNKLGASRSFTIGKINNSD